MSQRVCPPSHQYDMATAYCDHGFSKQREYRAKLAAKGDAPTPVAAFTTVSTMGLTQMWTSLRWWAKVVARWTNAKLSRSDFQRSQLACVALHQMADVFQALDYVPQQVRGRPADPHPHTHYGLDLSHTCQNDGHTDIHLEAGS